MFKAINRNNRLFMLGNFLFALSYGLWMNLRQLHLGDLGATPVEVGSVLGIAALAGGILPLPAGLLTDRIGPKRVMLCSWGIAIVGTVIAALATNWQMASIGYAVFMLVIAANPASVTFVLSNSSNQAGQAERVMATVFASWPAAMVFAPALGGLVADQWGIAADLWLAVVGFAAAFGVIMLATDIRPTHTEKRPGLGFRALVANRRFLTFAAVYPLVLMSLHVGFALAPTYLEGVRGYSTAAIGVFFSIMWLGSLGFNYVVGKAQPQVSFVVLVGAVWAGTFLIWQTNHDLLVGAAFALLGAISTVWLLAQTSFGQLVRPQERGLALGISETLASGAIALVSWLAGQFYERTPTHDLPLIVGAGAILVVLVMWFALSLGQLLKSDDYQTNKATKPTI